MDLRYIFPMILVLFILGVSIAVVAIDIGSHSGTQVAHGSFQSYSCSERLQFWSQDYGAYSERSRFFLAGQEVQFVNFGNRWLVPISTANCKIIEDNTAIYFQTLFLKNNLASVPANYFSSTRDCVNIEAAKGDNEICRRVSLVNTFVNSDAVKVVATLPTSSVEDTIKSMTKNGAFIRTVGTGMTAIKLASGQEITAMLEFTENTTCDSFNSPRLGIYGLADNANGILMKAKNNNEFETDTIPKLFGSTQLITSLWNVKVERQLIEASISKNPNLFEVAGYLIQTGMNICSFFVATAHDVTVELINYVQTPTCNSASQTEKFTHLQNILLDSNYLISYNDYTTQLDQYKESAMTSINREHAEKRNNQPAGGMCLVFAPKCLSYMFFDSNANTLYNNQLYVSAKMSADEFTKNYSQYWKENSLTDWTSSVIFWGAIVIASILFAKWFYRFRNEENPGPPVGPIC